MSVMDKRWIDAYVAASDALRIAQAYEVPVPRVGYEVSLGNGLWLQSTGHAQFGWFGRPRCPAPFRVYGEVKR